MEKRNKRIDRINNALNKLIEEHTKEYRLAMGTILLLFVLGAIVVEIVKPNNFLEIMTGFTIILTTLSVLATVGYQKVIQAEKENAKKVIKRIFNYEKQREQAFEDFHIRKEEKRKKEERERLQERKQKKEIRGKENESR